MRKRIIAALFPAAIIAFAVAMLVSIGAVHHNAQCEVHCDGQTDWNYLLAIFGSWFLILLPAGFAVSALVWIVSRRSN